MGHFPRSKIDSENIFLIKYYIITILKKGAFWFIFNKAKKWISHCNFKSCTEGFRFFFSSLEAHFFCKMACIYRLKSWGCPQSFYFDITYFISNYSYPLLVILKLKDKIIFYGYISRGCELLLKSVFRIQGKKNPAYGRHQLSRLMWLVEPIQIWRGCVIYL